MPDTDRTRRIGQRMNAGVLVPLAIGQEKVIRAAMEHERDGLYKGPLRLALVRFWERDERG